MIQQSFIDMESMFTLMSEEQDIKDLPEAVPLKLTQGAVEFNNVSFGYSNEYGNIAFFRTFFLNLIYLKEGYS